jgi:hypothetical protein
MEVRSSVEARDFSSSLCVQTGSGAHPASCTMSTGGPFPGAKRGRGVTLTTHPHLVPRSLMSRSYTSSPPLRLHGRIVGLFYLYLLLSNTYTVSALAMSFDLIVFVCHKIYVADLCHKLFTIVIPRVPVLSRKINPCSFNAIQNTLLLLTERTQTVLLCPIQERVLQRGNGEDIATTCIIPLPSSLLWDCGCYRC